MSHKKSVAIFIQCTQKGRTLIYQTMGDTHDGQCSILNLAIIKYQRPIVFGRLALSYV